MDIVAIKMKCCGTYYACKDCHEALAGHEIAVWLRSERWQRAVLCGHCQTELTIDDYLGSGNRCPACGAGFNPGCAKHYPYYFEMSDEPCTTLLRECNQLGHDHMVMGGTEIEVKIRLANASGILERLQGAGFTVSVPREFEANTLYETKDGSLARKGMLLRLRQVGERAMITWKGPGEPGPYKSRPELETSIGSVETMQRIFSELGYVPSFRYEKYRTEFTHAADEGVVTFDETPIGDFLELEGSGEWIDATAAKLGFSRADYVVDSYGRLYLADCERRGVEPGHMVFASQR